MVFSSTVPHNLEKKKVEELKGLIIMLLLSSDPARSLAAVASHRAVLLLPSQAASANMTAPRRILHG